MYELLIVALSMLIIVPFDLFFGYGHYAFYVLIIFMLAVNRNDIHKIKKYIKID